MSFFNILKQKRLLRHEAITSRSVDESQIFAHYRSCEGDSGSHKFFRPRIHNNPTH